MKKVPGIITAKVRTSYAKLTVALLLAKARCIYSAMLGNKNFPTPIPDMPTLLGLITKLEITYEAASGGDRNLMPARDAAHTNLLQAISSIGNYVNWQAANDLRALASSGYDFYKTKEPVILQPIRTLVVESRPNTNTLFINAKGGKGIKYFVYQYTTDAAMKTENWISIHSGLRKCSIEKLNKRQEYIVRILCYGWHDQSFCSDPISRIVQ